MSIQLDVTDTYIKEKLANLPEKLLKWAEEVLMAQETSVDNLNW
jgi:hypothetical protein